MSLQDPIADMLTRIRNGGRAEMSQVMIRSSKSCQGVAEVLKDEGYIEDYDVIDDGKQGLIRIKLRYTLAGDPVITELQRVSKPGCRIYRGADELPEVLGGLGVSIISTSKGIMSDKNCRKDNVGGEVICTVS
ncbi:30S ribosomal protein S8 [Anaerohalosphaera lusitana]|uniref:Small ribosomal subunit protein uS8 n=1 Tax=Anaerohalosphaera lusitana TaxID=1936003 RepID=A0A1U9NPJ9_9BACT|nr:30S ribosomal protein S8 [Anaerohalosphaera lusitana]AQT69839.1 30S ribosomal protein S8 [Anaerohalosphaera lusitana]